MRDASEFRIEAKPLSEAIRKAVDEDHMSLSEIAAQAAISVPTIARIYSKNVDFVQAKTARRIGEALGYEIEVSKNGRLSLEKGAKTRPSDKLTYTQKARLLKAFERLLNEL